MAIHATEHQSLTVSTAPTTEPVTLAEAKAWLRVDTNDNDLAIATAIAAARNAIEQWLQRQLLTAVYELRLDGFPSEQDNILRLPMGPVQSITSISYQDVDDNTTTQDLAKISQDLKSDPARLRPKVGEVWPTTRKDLNAITVKYSTGYGTVADIPGSILVALRMLLLDLIAHPGMQAEGKLVDNQAYERLLWPHRAWRPW